MDTKRELEDLIVTYVCHELPIADQHDIHNPIDILNRIDYDAENDLKERIWESILQELNWTSILNMIKEKRQDLPCESESENEEIGIEIELEEEYPYNE